MSDFDFDARRAAHRRGHSVPEHNRVKIDRSYDDIATFDVSQFVPGGVLTDANIDDAIDAAITAAHNFVSESYLLNTNKLGADVYVPAGRYTLSRRHDFPGTGVGTPTPGFRGAGSTKTEFVVNSDSGDWVFVFGGETATSTSYCYNMFVGGFSIVGYGGSAERSGIKFNATYHARVEDIYVFGFSQSQTYDKGWGIFFRNNGSEVHQHLAMRDVHVQEVTIPYYFEAIWQGNIRDCDAHSGYFYNVVVDSCPALTWDGGDLQYGPFASSALWHSGRNDATIVSGWNYTTGLSSGTGATVGVASGGLCTVTGVTGLHKLRDRGRYVRITPTGAASANKTTVAGLYKIEAVATDGNSFTIRKGSTHTSQADCDWQICGHIGGSSVVFTGSQYDETTKFADFGFYRDEVSSSKYVVRDAHTYNCTYAVDADGCGEVIAENIDAPAAKYLVRTVVKSNLDVPLSQVVFDDYAYRGLVCRSDNQEAGLSAGLRDSHGGTAARVRAACEQLGASEIWDARVPSSFTLATADVNAWAGLLHATSMVYNNAAAKPQYVAADASLGECVQIVGGAGDRGMSATLLAANLPTFPYTGTLFAVYRLGSAAVHTASGARGITMADASNAMFVRLGFHDNLLSANVAYASVRVAGFGSWRTSALDVSIAADTDAHALIGGTVGNTLNLGVQCSSDYYGTVYTNGIAVEDPAPSFTVGGNVALNVCPPDGSNTDEMFLAFIAVFPRSLTEDEHQRLIDLARNEWTLVK